MSDTFDHWQDGMDDKAIDDAKQNDPLSIFEKMLSYHGLDVDDWQNLSNTQKFNYRWNYNKFGNKGKCDD